MKYKVLFPEANGTGEFGEVLSSPRVEEPLTGFTQTFISIGAFDTQFEADAVLKYIKTRFARTLLDILKTTQHTPKATWAYVPLQDFTPSSDIDWTQSVSQIDEQLFDKYGLTAQERAFILSKVAEMKDDE